MSLGKIPVLTAHKGSFFPNLRYIFPLLAWICLAFPYTHFGWNFYFDFMVQTGRWVAISVSLIIGLFLMCSKPIKLTMVRFHLVSLVLIVLIVAGLEPADFLLGTQKAISIILLYLYLSVGVGSLIRGIEDEMGIAKALIFVLTLSFVTGLIGNSSSLIPSAVLDAWTGIFMINQNTVSALALMTLPLAFWFGGTQTYRPFAWCLALIWMVVIYFAGSRTALSGVFILMGYQMICRARRIPQLRGVAFISAILVIFTLTAAVAFQAFYDTGAWREFWTGVSNPYEGGISTFRMNVIWPLYLKNITADAASFFLGHGWGSEEALAWWAYEVDPGMWIAAFGTAHSAYIGLSYQIGVPGALLLFVPLWFAVIRPAVAGYGPLPQAYFEYRLALNTAVLGILWTCIFETGLYNLGAIHSLPSWLIIYLMVRSERSSRVNQ